MCWVVRRLQQRVRTLLASGWRWLWIALLVLLLDGLSKQWIMQHLALHEWRYYFPGFNLVYVKNSGAAFSLLATHPAGRWLFSVAALLVCGVLLRVLAYQPASLSLHNIAYSLIIGGAVGNLYDRVRYGAVIDFIDLHLAGWHWPAFNFADAAICLGCGLVLYRTLRASAPRVGVPP